MKTKNNDPVVEIISILVVAILGVSFFLSKAILHTRSPIIRYFKVKSSRLLILPILGVVVFFLAQFIFDPYIKIYTIIQIEIFLSLILFKVIFAPPPPNIVSTSDLGLKVQNFSTYKRSIFIKDSMPLGVSKIRNKVVQVRGKERFEHLLFVAATGHGKTTLMNNMIDYAIHHGEPVIVIDPKGDLDLRNRIESLASRHEKQFFEFTISDAFRSLPYNPLKNGSLTEIRDRLMNSLNWSEEFYKRKALEYLDKVIPIVHKMDGVVTIARLRKILQRKEEQARLLDYLVATDFKDKAELKSAILLLFQTDPKILTGLAGQLSSLDNYEYGSLLSPGSLKPNQIDLTQIIKDKGIVYFDVNTQLSRESSIATGKLILEDIKAISGAISSGKVEKPECVNLFIDEAASIITHGFIDFLTKCRSSKFSVNIFIQSIAAFDELGSAFKSQLIECTATKVIGRQDDPRSVDYLTGIAGTYNSFQESYQTKSSYLFGASQTGMGNLREAKKMRLEHDVIKQLNALDVVVIKKNPFKLDLMEIYKDWIG